MAAAKETKTSSKSSKGGSKASEPEAGLRFRALEASDLSEIVAIESSVYEDPWTEPLLEQSLKAPLTHTVGLFEADKTSGKLLGYAIYQVIFTEAHLLNLAIAAPRQGQGLGQKLLKYVMNEAKARGAFSFYLEVRPSNKVGQKLYERNGFRSLMLREKYYSNGEAAVIMVADLS